MIKKRPALFPRTTCFNNIYLIKVNGIGGRASSILAKDEAIIMSTIKQISRLDIAKVSRLRLESESEGLPTDMEYQGNVHDLLP